MNWAQLQPQTRQIIIIGLVALAIIDLLGHGAGNLAMAVVGGLLGYITGETS